MVIRIIFVFLLVGLFTNSAMSAKGKTGVELLADCKAVIRSVDNDKWNNDDLSFSNCVGYIDGVLDIVGLYGDVSREAGLQAISALICLPSNGISTGQAIRIVIKFLEENPERLHESKRMLIHDALLKAFPCDKAKK